MSQRYFSFRSYCCQSSRLDTRAEYCIYIVYPPRRNKVLMTSAIDMKSTMTIRKIPISQSYVPNKPNLVYDFMYKSIIRSAYNYTAYKTL